MKVRAGHRTYRIKPYSVMEAEDDKARAMTYVNQGLIRINPHTNPDEQAELVLHEITHALWDAHKMPEKATEEQVADFIGRAFAQLFRDNLALIGAVQAAVAGHSMFPKVKP